MRISTEQMFRQGANAITDQQANLSKTQLQLSTGQRMQSPADDPIGSAQALQLNQAVQMTQQYQTNADSAVNRLSIEDTTLDGVTNTLQRVRELAVQANSGALANSDRLAIAKEVQERLNELIGLANSKDGNGEYLFAGYQGQTQPFAQTATGTVTYNGDQGQRLLQISPGRQIAVGDSGQAVFMAVRDGNGTFATAATAGNKGTGTIDLGSVVDPTAYVADTYTISFVTNSSGQLAYNVTGATTGQVIPPPPADPVASAQNYASGSTITFNGIQLTITGQPVTGDSFTAKQSSDHDIFSTLLNLLNVLWKPIDSPASAAQSAQGIGSALANIDRALDNIDNTRAQVGARLNAIDSQKEVNDASSLHLQETLSQVQDLDYTEAISRLNQQLLGLQAAQQTFVKVQGLSLFNYLR